MGYDLSYLWKGLTLSCDSYLFPGGVSSSMSFVSITLRMYEGVYHQAPQSNVRDSDGRCIRLLNKMDVYKFMCRTLSMTGVSSQIIASVGCEVNCRRMFVDESRE